MLSLSVSILIGSSPNIHAMLGKPHITTTMPNNTANGSGGDEITTCFNLEDCGGNPLNNPDGNNNNKTDVPL